MTDRPLDVFLVVGEHSGDQLGARLMEALRRAGGDEIRFRGIGGEAMAAQGLTSLFALTDVAVMGLTAVAARLPLLLRRISDTAAAVVAAKPDIVVIIDSPGFTHTVAARVRRHLPEVPIVDYVSPSVWAWRPGRARKMGRFVDHLLALLPFEPAVHARLGGPPCTYVGHPLIERLKELRPSAVEEKRRLASPPVVLILPGSRRTEIKYLLQDFGSAMARVTDSLGAVDFVLPAVSHLEREIRELVARWPLQPRIVTGEEAKWSAFRVAHAALAASGTVTLELALAGVPMVVGYKVSRLEEQLKYVIKVPSIVLPNLILGDNFIPELLQRDCRPERLADALIPLIRGGAERDAQLTALSRLDDLMRLPSGGEPSDLAAKIVLEIARKSPRLAGASSVSG